MNAAQTIRKEIKAKLGLSSRQVSVRTDGGSINVVIKVLAAMAPIKTIAMEHQRVSYCQYTNEILSGGNTFVSVSYDFDMIEEAAKPFLAAIDASNGQINFAPFQVDIDSNDAHNVTVWELDEGMSGHHIASCWDTEGAAAVVVRNLLDAGLPLTVPAPVAPAADDAHLNMLASLGC